MSGVKRAANGKLAEPQTKKLHPLFTGGITPSKLGSFLPSPPTLVHFVHLDPFASSPEATTSSSSTPRRVSVVLYDLDGTLIKTRSGNAFPSSRDDWVWWHPNVPAKLKKEFEEGKHLVVVSNQGRNSDKIRDEWRAKVSLIAAKMPAGVPLRVLAALSMEDIYRKPNIGMYATLSLLYASHNLEIDLENSVFVGDAAGRSADKQKGRRKDHSDTDLKWALNVGVKFVTPEQHFLGWEGGGYPIPPNGFKPSMLGGLAALPHIVPSNTPIVRKQTEIILFVGPPASGKTSFYERHFLPAGYEHVNQDILKTRDKCLSVAEAFLKGGRSVVIDATNRNRATRAVWIQLSASLSVPIRLFHFLTPLALARHNNVYRAIYAPPPAAGKPRTLLPQSAFASYAAQFEEPKKEEGFDEIRGVNFRWEGEDEERKHWDMWMLEPKR